MIKQLYMIAEPGIERGAPRLGHGQHLGRPSKLDAMHMWRGAYGFVWPAALPAGLRNTTHEPMNARGTERSSTIARTTTARPHVVRTSTRRRAGSTRTGATVTPRHRPRQHTAIHPHRITPVSAA